MVACAPPLLVRPDSGRCGRAAGRVFGSGTLSTASTTVPYRSAFFVRVGEAESEGEADGVGDDGVRTGGRAVLAAVGAAARGAGSSGVCVTTYAPPAASVAPAVTATAGWV